MERDVLVNMLFRLAFCRALVCFIFIFNLVAGKSCDINTVEQFQCPQTQYCDDLTRTCICKPGYLPLNDTFCIRNDRNHHNDSDMDQMHHDRNQPNSSSLVDSHNSGSIVAGILIPLILILFVIYGIYINRKYQLLNWLRRKLNQRTNNYDEFMIGQDAEDDDPPLR